MAEDKELKDALSERKEKIINFVSDKDYIPMKEEDIAAIMEVPPSDYGVFSDLCAQLVSQGYIVKTRKGKLMSAKKLDLYRGSFTGNAKGFGFVTIEGMEDDVFIPPTATNGAMHKDTVLVKLLRQSDFGKRQEGEVVNILERGLSRIIGTYEEGRKGSGFVIPDNKKIGDTIYVSAENSRNAVTGHKVAVNIAGPVSEGRSPEGVVTEIIGHIGDPGVDVLSIVLENNLHIEFSEKVMKETESMPSECSEADFAGREDFRDCCVFTIDGEDAKDFDDAVFIEKIGSGYRLHVHIADVTHYVKEGTAIGDEAFERGTSVYLVDRVIPMLPHKLSNGICSLNPYTDRLTLSCIMDISEDGKVTSHRIVEGVINSKYRMTYTIVNDLIENEKSEHREKYAEILPLIEMMNELRLILGRKREKRGAIELGLSESKIIVNKKGKPTGIEIRERNSATNLIEEFMLVCNETVAEEYFWAELPFVYRTHDEPDSEKSERLSDVISGFGYRIKGSILHPKTLQDILKRSEERPEKEILSALILRSMKQAVYTVDCKGHFGLAAKYYCHFTSPIRRYPDLQIHRIIKENIHGKLSEHEVSRLNKLLPEVSRHCSITERTAEHTEREVDNLKKVEYMADKVGQIFKGIISGVTRWGLYITLPNTVEGLLSVSELDDDYYIYDETGYRFIGKHKKRTYSLGDSIEILVAKANVADRKLDFVLAAED